MLAVGVVAAGRVDDRDADASRAAVGVADQRGRGDRGSDERHGRAARAAHGRGVHDGLGRSGIEAQHGQRRAAIGLGDADEPAGGLGELRLEVGAMAGPRAGVWRPGDARRVGAGAGVVARDLQWRPIAAAGSDEQDRDERDESAHSNDGRDPGRARSLSFPPGNKLRA